MASIHRAFLVLAVCICASCVHRAAPPPAGPAQLLPPPGSYFVAGEIQVGGEGRWDYITLDPRSKILYVPRQTHVQMILAGTGDVIADVKDTPGVHGVALVPEMHRAFSSNGQGNNVTVFDLDTARVLGTIVAGEKPDAILYDPSSKRVLVFNGKSHDVTVIDPSQDPKTAITRTVALEGGAESAASDDFGRVFVNLEDRSAVAVIDTRSMSVIAQWPIEGGEEPTGIAIDRIRHRIYCGCHNQVLAVLDTQTGKTLARLPIGKGVDACEFDALTGKAFASCGDGTLTVARETRPEAFEVIQTVTTPHGARTMVLDPTTHVIYMPTAEFPATAPAGGRPAPNPGSFKIVAVFPRK